jgi:peptidyl-prolyl cis-trans isomerase D
MLQAIRSRASGIVVQILFGLLILTFGLWGIGDIFRGRAPDTSVATVGDIKISPDEVSQALRQQIDNLRRSTNTSPTPEQIKELGLLDTTLQNVIDRHLIDLEAARLGLAITDEAVRQEIVSNAAFHNPSGAFDRGIYLQTLAANQLSDQQYEALLREDMIRARLVEPVTAGASPPPELLESLWQARGERRVAEAVLLPQKAVGDIPPPDQATLEKFYEAHKNLFMEPERRSFTLALLDPAALASAIKIPDDQLAAEYKERIDQFRTPEKRDLQQILVADDAKLKAVQAALAAGKDFAQVAHDIAGESDDTLKLGALARTDLPDELAKVAFALKPGEVSQPIKDSFGSHIFKALSVTPEQLQTLDQVKVKLAQELAQGEAADDAAKTANAVDDALANGAKFSDVVAKFNLKPIKVEEVDANGHDAQGKDVALPPPADDILKTAFATAAGADSDLKDAPNQGFYLVAIDGVTAAAPQPLVQIRDRVMATWQAEERETRLAKLADGIADAVKGGQSLDDVAALHGLKPFETKPLTRVGRDNEQPPALTAKLFSAKRGEAVTAPASGNEGYIVAVVKDVLPPDPAQEAVQKDAIARQLAPAMQSDMLDQYERALRSRFPVTVDQAALDRVL